MLGLADLSQVAIVYVSEEQVDAEKTKKLITATGQKCLLLPQDIRDEQGCIRVIDEVVRAFGRIDILVNNASVMVRLSPRSGPDGSIS